MLKYFILLVQCFRDTFCLKTSETFRAKSESFCTETFEISRTKSERNVLCKKYQITFRVCVDLCIPAASGLCYIVCSLARFRPGFVLTDPGFLTVL